MKRLMAGVLAVVAVALMAPEDPEPKKKDEPPPKADVRGEVKSVTGLKAKDLVANILVEGAKEKDTQHDKASVTLTNATKVYVWAGGKKREAKLGDVKQGVTVQCTFTGPVLESYPVQARAAEVLILEQPKKK
jgi:beta-N-acetylhexosaminidase